MPIDDVRSAGTSGEPDHGSKSESGYEDLMHEVFQRLERMYQTHYDLALLMAMLVLEAGGEVRISEVTQAKAERGMLSIHTEPEDGSFVVRFDHDAGPDTN